MGTVVVGFNPDHQTEVTMKSILTNTFEEVTEDRDGSVEGQKVNFEKKGSYDRVYTKDHRNRIITVLSKPKPYFRQLKKFKIILHFSHFTNLKMIKAYLTEIFNLKIADLIFNVAVLNRIDIWFDTKNKYKSCLEAFLKRKIRSTSELKAGSDNKKGTYFGSMKSQKYYFVYQKKTKYVDGEDVTRIEKRFFGKECPIKHLSEYHKLLEIDVFKDLEIYVRKSNLKKFVERKSNNFNPHIIAFVDELYEDGLQCARKQVSRCKSFHNDVWPFFANKCRQVSLTGMYHKRLTRFLNDQEVVWN